MQPVFTIQYAEFKTANYFSDEIKNCSVFIPSSAQEEGIDLLLYRYSNNQNKTVTVQVKMSRTYYGKRKKDHKYYLWFNRYNVPDNADWNVLVGIYPKIRTKPKGGTTIEWATIMLAFTKAEMKSFMSTVKQKKDPTKDDKMFGFCFDDEDMIFQNRGWPTERDMSRYLIKNRIAEIDAQL